MKRILTAAAFAAVVGVSGCDKAQSSSTEPKEAGAPAVATTLPRTRESALPTATTIANSPAGDAPAFAAVYPGADLESPPVLAGGPSGRGGIFTFQTQADPEMVVAFYRQKAEAAGLASVTAMNMGEARSYGAAARSGENLQVVASPADEGLTSVQVTWSLGR